MVSVAPAATLRAAIYIRVSKAEQLEGFSPEGMATRCRAKAADLGADVVAVFVESGRGDDWELPKLWETLRLAEARGFDILISFDTGRLARDMGKRLWIKTEMRKHGVSIRYANVEFDSTPEGELQENIFGSFDQYERAKIGMRTALGIHTKLSLNLVIGNGRTPYGYARVLDACGRTVSYTPKEPGAGIVRRIADELTRDTLARVCERLNAEGISAPSGAARWTGGGILSLLRNTVYVGEYRWGTTIQRRQGGKVVKMARDADEVKSIAVPAILTHEQLRAAQAGLTRRKRNRRPRRAEADDPYTLRGMLTCGHCGGALSCTKNNGYRRYTCLRAYGPQVGGLTERCPLPQLSADDVERHAWERLASEMLDLDRMRASIEAATEEGEAMRRHRSQLEGLGAEIALLTKRIELATEDLYRAEEGSATANYARDVRARAERELKALRASYAELEARKPAGLSRADADAIMELVEDITRGVAVAERSPAKQRQLFRLLNLASVVGLSADETGERFGRRHRFAVAWDGFIKLSGNGKLPDGSLM